MIHEGTKWKHQCSSVTWPHWSYSVISATFYWLQRSALFNVGEDCTRALGEEVMIILDTGYPSVWIGAGMGLENFAFLTSSQLMLMLLTYGPHFENTAPGSTQEKLLECGKELLADRCSDICALKIRMRFHVHIKI